MDEIVEKIKAAYDEVPYECNAYRQTHPNRLAVEAVLRGLSAPAIDRCRVLEIGCASGENLIPMAEQLPLSRLIGIDLSARQIETGASIIRELGLTNIELRCLDLMEFPQDWGKFDYIIAHGFYSWAPKIVQARLLEVCRDHLAQNGLAYISYNAYPGWRHVEIGREMMLYHTRDISEPMQRAQKGREIIQAVTEHTADMAYYRENLRSIQKTMSGESNHQLLHDKLGNVNHPQYFWQFMEACKAHGLGYVGEAGIEPDPWFRLAEPVRDMISKMSADPLDREQYIDFFINRSFRSSIICHAEVIAELTSPPANRFRDLHVTGNAPEIPAGTNAQGRPISEFGTGLIKIRVSDPGSVEVLRRVSRSWPAAVAFTELQEAVVALSANKIDPQKVGEDLGRLLETYHRLGLIELWAQPMRFIASSVDHFPLTTRYIRWQAAHDKNITSLRHFVMALEPAFRQLLALLDGTRDKQMLAEELIQRKLCGAGSGWPAENPQQLGQKIEEALEKMLSAGFLLNHADNRV